MAFQITIQHHNTSLIYDVTIQENNVYQLRLNSKGDTTDEEYIPEKIIIRRKGKIWISDMDNYDELLSSLTNEIIQFDSKI
ncbi:MAG: hypothetical protein ACTHMD_07745 [Flavisolibacter sp.]